MESRRYMEQGIDLKRLVLVLGKKLWLILAGVILGAVLGGIIYKIVTNVTNGEPEYQANADYYITFNFDEFNYGADYYNAYTWDGILRDDPIVDYALTLLPEEITKDMVKAAVTGEMLGDYRILTVHVKTESKEKSDLIAAAYEKSLWNFGQEIELLDRVELWSQEEAVLFEKNTKTGNAAFLGVLIAFCLVTFGLLFYYCLEDAVYVEKDAERRFGLPVYGLLTKGKDAVQEQIYRNNLEHIFQEGSIGNGEIENPEAANCKTDYGEAGNGKAHKHENGKSEAEKKESTKKEDGYKEIVNNGNHEIKVWNGEEIPASEDFAQLRNEKNLLVNIPWGRNNGRQIERVLRQLELQDCEVKGLVITEAEDKFVKAYYAVERSRKAK